MASPPKTPARTSAKAKPADTGRDALFELGRAMVGELSAEASWQPADAPERAGGGRRGGAEVELALADLIRDGNGEIVIYNDSNFRTLAITTEATVVASGESGRHVTEAGEDVSGFRFVTFDDGTTLYYQEGLDVLVTQPGPA